MGTMISRRLVLAGLATPFLVRGSLAQSPASLDALKKAGVIKIGLVNQPPYSSLNIDGTIGGFVPTLTKQIMNKLGIEKVEPYAAGYGELIPGLQAGRWQMIAAAFRFTKERCGQVLFTDPVTFDGGGLAYVGSKMPKAPTSIKDLVGAEGNVGVLQGSYLAQLVVKAGLPQDRVSQFPSNPALIDGLQAGRVIAGLSTNAALREVQKQRGGFDIVYPLSEDPPVGSAPAFAKGDTELYSAFQTELRAMRKSGELWKMAQQFGFDAPPADMAELTSEKACSAL